MDRVAAEKRNAQVDVQRYEALYKAGNFQSASRSKRLSAETSTQQLIENQANKTRTVATLEQQIKEAKANGNQTIASLQQQINEAKATLNQTVEVRPTDIANAQAEVDSAQATVAKIRAQLDQAYVRAPEAGQILKIHTRAGETVSSDGIVELGRTDQMYAVAEVYQSDINKVRSGQRVKVISDSIPEELQGTVDWTGMQVQRQNLVNSDPSSNIDARVVEVHVQLDRASSAKAAKFTNLQVKAVIELWLDLFNNCGSEPSRMVAIESWKSRLLVALSGIAFADILMFMQLGFQTALFDSNTKLHNSIQADIFLLSPQARNVLNASTFTRRRLYQAMDIQGWSQQNQCMSTLSIGRIRKHAKRHLS